MQFRNATTGFPSNWRLRIDRRNSILMIRHYPKRGNASDSLRQISHAARPIRNTSQISKVARDRLRSLLRRRFAEKPVVASRNVGCFLRLPLSERFETSQFFFFTLLKHKTTPDWVDLLSKAIQPHFSLCNCRLVDEILTFSKQMIGNN